MRNLYRDKIVRNSVGKLWQFYPQVVTILPSKGLFNSILCCQKTPRTECVKYIWIFKYFWYKYLVGHSLEIVLPRFASHKPLIDSILAHTQQSVTNVFEYSNIFDANLVEHSLESFFANHKPLIDLILTHTQQSVSNIFEYSNIFNTNIHSNIRWYNFLPTISPWLTRY